jgi:cobalamin synthase
MASREDWQRRLGPLYGGAVALTRSTPWRWPSQVSDEPRTVGWLVALGIPVGVAAWAVAALGHALGLPATVAALCGLAALSLGSAALVERGLAEQVDHWTGQGTRASIGLDRDGAAGSPGIAALLAIVFATLIRASAIAALPPSRWLAVLIATALVGRWSAMFIQAFAAPVGSDDARRSLIAAPAPAWLVAAISLAALIVTVVAVGKIGILALAIAAVAAFALGARTERRDGTLSGPAVATAAAIGELSVLLCAVIA